MQKAVNFYLEHGKNLNLAIEVLGYPSRPGTLSAWIDEFAPGEKRGFQYSGIMMVEQLNTDSIRFQLSSLLFFNELGNATCDRYSSCC